jgi:hypothetical protein
MKKEYQNNQTHEKEKHTNTNIGIIQESSKPSILKDGMEPEENQSVDFSYGQTQKEKHTNNGIIQKRTNKQIHALDVYIIFCFISIIIYTIVHTIIFYKLGIEATVLDALFYGVFGGEVLLCALLKRLKLKQEFELNKTNNTNGGTYEE